MPELPEVETVRTGLARHLPGKRIAMVELRRADLRMPFPVDFAQMLAGKRVEAVERRAKYLLIRLSGGLTLIAHLGMSGSFRYTPKGERERGKHDHVIFHFEGGDTLVFNDPRRFGLMTLAKTASLSTHPLFAGLGPEPLSEEFSIPYLENALRLRRQPVKGALMDQKLVVGVGNIYASEALFLAGVHPARPAQEVAKQAPALIASIQEVLKAAIASGGSSLRDHVQVNGETGYFQHAFQVYGREGAACMRCKSRVMRTTQAGRSTFYCSNCQK